jgi:4-hydroxybenzoate polyprenyltransferase
VGQQQVIREVRLFIALARPAVIALFGLFTALGMAQAGRPNDPVLLAEALLVVVAFLVFAIGMNDVADEAIDRVNLAGDKRRPLVTGIATPRDVRIVAGVAAVVAMGGAIALGGPIPFVVAGGLAFATVYSVPPWRLASRGIVAPLTLPAGYVAVPFFVGLLAVRPNVTAGDLALAASLYVGFIGRIVLKDFRDVRGDALFGKRTFLVRRGRRATCVLSAVCSTVGTVALVVAAGPTAALAACSAALLVATLALVQRLAGNHAHRRDDALIAAIAICGRGILLVLLAQLTVTDAGWPSAAGGALLLALTALTVAQARTMAHHGPPLRAGASVSSPSTSAA